MRIPQWTYGGPKTNCRSWFFPPTMLVLGSKLRSSALVPCLYAPSHSASLSPMYKWNYQRYLFVMSQVFPDNTWWSWKVSPGRWNSELSQHYLSNLTNEFRPTVPLVLTEPRNQKPRAQSRPFHTLLKIQNQFWGRCRNRGGGDENATFSMIKLLWKMA